MACVEGPTEPGRFGELRIRPSYAAADGPTELGFALDSARVRIARASNLSEPLVDSVVAYTSDTASLGWLLDLLDTEEAMRVAVTIWDDGARLYSGERDVQVIEGSSNGEATDLPVLYVGPPIVATLTVAPNTITLDALGLAATLSAVARDRHDQIVTTPLAWSSDNDAIARVDPATGIVTAHGNGTTTVRADAGGKQGTATVVVSQRVATVAVTPSATKLTALGATVRLSAQAKDSRGNLVESTAFAWTTADPSVASVDADGLVAAVAGGLVTISAKVGDVAGTAKVKVNPTENVASIVVLPSNASLGAIGATQEFTAVARDANGNVLTGVQFDWMGSADNVASIDVVTGVARAVGHGTATVTATAGAVTGTAALSVDLSSSIASIVVTPGSSELTSVGAVQQFIAEARDASGAVVPVATFDWSSSAPEVAGIDPTTGLATASAHGTTMIRARAGAATGTASLGVSLTARVAIVIVSPGAVTLTAIGALQQYTAEAHDANGVVVPVASFEWSSGEPGVATVGVTGEATAVAHGTTMISASVGGISGSAPLDVSLTASVASIAVSPSGASLTAVGASREFTAIARDASGSILRGVEFTWSTGAAEVASVDPVTGVARAVGHGTTTITASAGSAAGTASLTVDLSAAIVTVVLNPATTTLTSVGAVQQFTAEARDASGAIVPVATFAWTTGTPDVASVDPATGMATAAGHGSAEIVATVGGVSGSATLTVDLAPSVATIVVSPVAVTLTAVGAMQQFAAEARDANGALLPGVPFLWTSSTGAVATIDAATGLATAVAAGTTTIQASSGTVTGNTILTVDLRSSIATIVVTPGDATLTVFLSKQQYTAVALDANGVVVPGIVFTWSSSMPAVAPIDAVTGSASAFRSGVTTIAATAGSVSGTATLTIQLP